MPTYAGSVFNSLMLTTLPAAETYSYNKDSQRFTLSELSIMEKTVYYSSNFFKALICTAVLPVAVALSLLNSLKSRAIECVYSPEKPKEKVLSDREIIQYLSEIGGLGFADSLFQTSGLGTEFSQPDLGGECDWREWVRNPQGPPEGPRKVYINSTSEELAKSYINLLDHPDSLVSLLKKLGATAYRFSLERSVIEPKRGEYNKRGEYRGEYNKEAIAKYIRFCQTLKAAGIEPWITLDHYVCPKWFAASRGFQNEENIENFASYACQMIKKFHDEAGVSNFMTFNELGVDGFQREVRRSYPAHGEVGLRASFINMRNRMRAHCTVFARLKPLIDRKEIKLGLTHQFLKFKPSNPYNIIEKTVCYVLCLITHYFVFNFFKDGDLRVPFFMNTKIENVDGRKPLSFLGVQSYGYAPLKIGFGTGREPCNFCPPLKYKVPLLGYVTKYHTFVAGATTSDENQNIQSFGPRVSPEDFEDVLNEASELNIPLAVTENGCDANIGHVGENAPRFDEEPQRKYFEDIFPIIARFKKQLQENFLAYLVWALPRGQHEWGSGVGDRNKGMMLGVVDFEKDPITHRITNEKLSPAAEHIQKIFTAAQNARDILCKIAV